MRSALLAVAAFVLVSCSAPCPTAPVERSSAKMAKEESETCRNGFVIRTGRNGSDSTYTGCS